VLLRGPLIAKIAFRQISQFVLFVNVTGCGLRQKGDTFTLYDIK
jgi:hypothetical protein